MELQAKRRKGPRRRGQGGGSTPSKSSAIVQRLPGCTLTQYAEAKKLDISVLQIYGLKDCSYSKTPAVRIPYFDENMGGIAIRYRLALEKGVKDDTRFRWKSGSKPVPYGLWKLEESRNKGVITLVEGESDCHTLWSHGLPALGLPGASNWKNEWEHHLDGFSLVYVMIEPDQGGEAIRKWLAKTNFCDRVKLVSLGDTKDPSNLYLSDSERFIGKWNLALENAIPWKGIGWVGEKRNRG